jgi:hypothetical protein
LYIFEKIRKNTFFKKNLSWSVEFFLADMVIGEWVGLLGRAEWKRPAQNSWTARNPAHERWVLNGQGKTKQLRCS